MSLSRRQFCEWLGGSGLLAASLPSVRADLPPFQEPPTAAQTGSHVGNLYPFVQAQADRSRFELSFLQDKFRALEPWQKIGAGQSARTPLLRAARNCSDARSDPA